MPRHKKLTFAQITTSQWDGDHGLTSTVYGLTKDGKVYRYKPSENAWIFLGDEEHSE